MRILRSFWLWCVGVLLVVGIGFYQPTSSSSTASRIAHLESLIRCPSCEDLSVAASNQTASVAVRNEIVADVHAGWSDSRIIAALEAVYGSSILLSPSLAGIGILLWTIPLVALVALVAVIWRMRSRQ
jgi:cytochrome c-type biogenesis protein CcmH